MAVLVHVEGHGKHEGACQVHHGTYIELVTQVKQAVNQADAEAKAQEKVKPDNVFSASRLVDSSIPDLKILFGKDTISSKIFVFIPVPLFSGMPEGINC